jgi:hypothetical protein
LCCALRCIARGVSQFSFEELGASHTERPVSFGVLRDRDDQVRRGEASSLQESVGESGVEGRFLILGAPLLGDLNYDYVVRALEAEPCILGYYPTGLVFVDHLIVVPIGLLRAGYGIVVFEDARADTGQHGRTPGYALQFGDDANGFSRHVGLQLSPQGVSRAASQHREPR